MAAGVSLSLFVLIEEIRETTVFPRTVSFFCSYSRVGGDDDSYVMEYLEFHWLRDIA